MARAGTVPDSDAHAYASAWRRPSVTLALVGAILGAPAVGWPLPARTTIILAVNDTYRIEGLGYDYDAPAGDKQAGVVGGLARLRTLRDTLDRRQRELDQALRAEVERRLDPKLGEKLDPTERARHQRLLEELIKEEGRPGGGGVLLLHAGDFLFPSLLSRRYHGEQMVEVLNLLAWTRSAGTGTRADIDPHMIVVFGNHEFDEGTCSDGARFLRKNVANSRFFWLHSNIIFADCFGSKAEAGGRLRREAEVVTVGGVRIGVFGITTSMAWPDYVRGFDRGLVTARRQSARLREQKADVVVALTHLDKAEDKKILDTLRDEGPDLIVGGHDHEKMAEPVKWKTTVRAASEGLVTKHEESSQRFVYKADADARTASVITITVSDDSPIAVHHRWVQLTDAVAPHPEVQDKVAGWLARHEQEFCQELVREGKGKDPTTCLKQPLGKVEAVPLVGEESTIRRTEASLGNWLTDVMRKACGADVAFINAGSLRLNQDLPVGTILRRRHIEELFAYPTKLRVLTLTGAQLRQVVDHAVQEWPGSGRWLQVSGFAFRHRHDDSEQADSAKRDRTVDLTWLAASGPQPLGESVTVKAVTSDFLAAGGDDYQMLKSVPSSDCRPGGREDLKDFVLDGIEKTRVVKAAAPEGRICANGSVCRAVAGGGTGALLADTTLVIAGVISVIVLVLASAGTWFAIVRGSTRRAAKGEDGAPGAPLGP